MFQWAERNRGGRGKSAHRYVLFCAPDDCEPSIRRRDQLNALTLGITLADYITSLRTRLSILRGRLIGGQDVTRWPFLPFRKRGIRTLLRLNDELYQESVRLQRLSFEFGQRQEFIEGELKLVEHLRDSLLEKSDLAGALKYRFDTVMGQSEKHRELMQSWLNNALQARNLGAMYTLQTWIFVLTLASVIVGVASLYRGCEQRSASAAAPKPSPRASP